MARTTNTIEVGVLAFLMALRIANAIGENGVLTQNQAGVPGMKDRFRDHGVAVPVAQCRGVYSVKDGNGANLVIATSLDESPRGWILVTDIDKGLTEQVFCPDNVPNSPPYQSVMGSNGRFYTSQGGIFLEFDPTSRKWTFQERGKGAYAMLSMAEGPDGTIWMGDVYKAGLHSFNPKTREFRSYGRMDDRETYCQYLGFDDKGWVYCGIGTARDNLVAYNPKTGERRQLVPEDQRVTNIGRVWKGADETLYGAIELKDGNKYFVLSNGRGTPVEKDKTSRALPPPAGGKPVFPDGRIVSSYDFASRRMEIYDPSTLSCRRIEFDYDTAGSKILPQAMTAGADGKIYLNTGHPSFFASYDPKTDVLHRFPDPHAQQSLTVQGKYIVGGRYTGGKVKLFDTTRPWNKVPPPPEIVGGIGSRDLLKRASTKDGELSYMVERDTLAFRARDWGGQVNFKMKVAEAGDYNVVMATESIPESIQVQVLVDGGTVGKPMSIQRADRDYIARGPVLAAGPTRITAGEHVVSVKTVQGNVPEILVLMKAMLLTRLNPEKVVTQPPSETNPFRAIPSSRPDINRPIVSFAHPDGKNVMIAGMPCYGRTGGGLSIYNIETREITKLSHEDLMPYHSITALTALTNGNLVGSTTVSGTHGGHAVEKDALLFELDWKTKTVAWKMAPMSGMGTIKLSKLGADGRLYCTGVRSQAFLHHMLFVFDLKKKKVIHEQSLVLYGYGSRIFELPDGRVYFMTRKAILKLDLDTYEIEKVADAPVDIGVSAMMGDRIYFASGSHLWSFKY